MYRSLAVFILIFSFASCNERDPEYIPPIDDISVDFEIVRFDEALASVGQDSSTAVKRIAELKEKYPAFFKIYFANVLPIKGDDPNEFVQNLMGFLTDPRVERLIDTTSIVFPRVDNIRQEFDQAFRVYKYYFPQFEAPNVYMYISEFSHQAFIFPDVEKDGIGIGLDMFLGSSYPYVRMARENPAFSQYLVRAFNKDHIVRKGMFMIIDDVMGPPPGNRLLDHMIHNGKKLFVLDKSLPTVPDSIIMEYSAKEIEWVEDSELGMWSFFFDQDLFYETNMMKINKYINPSPDSPGMPDGAPGRTANYMGWQIVKAYMERYPKTSLQQLIALDDAQMIMDKSKYKPKRK